MSKLASIYSQFLNKISQAFRKGGFRNVETYFFIFLAFAAAQDYHRCEFTMGVWFA